MSPYEIFNLLISFAALAFSIFSVLTSYYDKHVKTRIYLRWLNQPSSDRLNLSLLISNMSSRPSTVTNIYLRNVDENKESTWFPVLLTSITGTNLKSWTDATPFNIPARSTKNVVIAFTHIQFPQEFNTGDKIELSYIIDGSKFKREYEIKAKIDNQQLSEAVKDRLK